MSEKRWTDYLRNANYYWILDLDEALDPVADNARLAEKIDAADPAKVQGARAALLKALKEKMATDLKAALSAPAGTPSVWERFRADYATTLKKRPSAQRRGANTILDVLGEAEIDRNLAKAVVAELGDEGIFEEVARARKIAVVDKRRVEISRDFAAASKSARSAVNALLPYLKAHGADDIYQLLTATTGMALSADSTDAEVLGAIAVLKDARKTAVGKIETRGLPINEIRIALNPIFKAGDTGNERSRGLFDDILKLEMALPFLAALRLFGRLNKIDTVRRDQVERLAARAAAATGLAPDRVLELIKGLLDADRVQLGKWGLSGHFRSCGACGAINVASDTNCAACKSELYVVCANCDARFDDEAEACPTCGTTKTDGEAGRSALARAARALERDDMDHALRTIGEAGRLVPRSQTLADLNAQLARRRSNTKAEETRLTTLVKRERKMCEALKALSKLSGGFNRSLANELRHQIEQSIAKADEKVASARKQLALGESEAAGRHLRAALDLVADHESGMDLLARLPPPPPIEVKARCRDATVVLTWKRPATAPEGLVFVAVRSIGARARSVGEGEAVGQTTALSHTDPDPPFGVPLYYSVLSRRRDVDSLQPAHANEVLVLAAVTDLKARADGAVVRLSWRLPPGARSAEIHRLDPEVQKWRAADTKALAHAHDRYADDGARKGRTYRYHVTACYLLPDGSMHRASPQSVLARVVEPPSTVANFHLARKEGVLRWSAATRPDEEDQVLVFPRGAAPPAVHALIDEGDLCRLDPKPAILSSAQKAQLPIAKLPFGRHRLVVCRTSDGQCRIGPSLDMDHVTPPEDVTLELLENGAELSWRWPKGCRMARLRLSVGGQLSEEIVKVDQGERTASRYFEARPPAEISASVTALIDRSGPESLPVTRTGEMVRRNRLSYEVKERRSGLFGAGGRETILEVCFDHAENLPKFEIRFHHEHKPAAGEGECLKIVETRRGVTDRHEEEITTEIGRRKGFIGIVLSDPALRQRIDIIPINPRVP